MLMLDFLVFNNKQLSLLCFYTKQYTKMETPASVGNAHASLLVSIFTAAVSFADAGEAMKSLAGLISIIAGIMAIRYYYHATKSVQK